MVFRPDIVGAAVRVRCVCCAFRKIPPGTYSPGYYFNFLQDPPPPLSYPRSDGDGDGDGDRFL